MKYSIIIPVYNGEETINECLNKLINLNYKTNKYEIIIINDCSTDNTNEIIKNIQNKNKHIKISIINNNKNKGRSLTREIGAKSSKTDKLVFIDSRCIADKEILNDLDKYKDKYQAIIGNAHMNINRSLFDICFHLLHNQIYKPYFGEKFENLKINSKNFDISPKGTGVFFCNKDLFLKSQISNKENKNASDDTKLLKNILNISKIILKTSKFKVIYLTRTNLIQNLNHIFHRGPKFIDYYFKKNSAYNKFIWTFISSIIIILSSLIYNSNFIFTYFYTLIIITILIGLYLSKNVKDFISSITILPAIIFVFSFGLLKGIILKILNKL